MLAGSAFAGQVLVAAALPLLSRLYKPAEFGLATAFASVVGIVTIVASLRYEVAIPLPRDDGVAATVLVLSVVVVLSVAALVGVGIALAGTTVLGWLNLMALSPFMWILPLSVVGIGLYQTFTYWAVRKGQFGSIARSRLSQSLTMVLAQCGLGLIGAGPLGLLIGDVLGRMSGVIALARATWRNAGPRFARVTARGVALVARRYRRFPLLSSWAALLNSFGMGLPPLFLAAQYGPQVVGWFALGQKVLGAPLSVIAASVNQVYIADAAKALHTDPERLRPLLGKALIGVACVAVPYVVVVVLAGPTVFSFMFGAGWAEAGTYVRILAVMCLLEAMASATGGVLDVLERQDLHLAREITRVTLLSGAGLFAGLLHATPVRALALISGAGSVAYIVYVALSIHALGAVRPSTTLGDAGGQS